MAGRNYGDGSLKGGSVKCLDFQYNLKILTKNFSSCSLVNSDGALIFSKDQNPAWLTTTRLVAFQIVKKYLKPQPRDLFILNDPENGGFQYSKLLFIAALSNNLFLIWDEEFHFIDFKIPPTPLYDQGVKNEFVWKALIQSNEHASAVEFFILQQKAKIDCITSLKKNVDELSSRDNQAKWLKSTQEIFHIQFNNKALGNFETQAKLKNGQFIKLKFSAEERQNIKLFTLDFTNTNLATDFYAASHVVESAIVKKIVEFYDFGDFFTQSILDKIKVILPPRSIVSKPNPSGENNLEIQAVCSQLCEHNLLQMNTHSRKSHAQFDFVNFLNFHIRSGDVFVSGQIHPQAVVFNGFEDLITRHLIEIQKMRKGENQNQIKFKVLAENDFKVKINNRYITDEQGIRFKINSVVKDAGQFALSGGDLVEIEWN